MTPYERLIQESVPTRPASARQEPWTPAEQDQHWRALCHAVGTPNAQRPTPASPN